MKEHKYYDYGKQHIDKDSQITARINNIEEFILRPQKSLNGILDFTEDELKQYIDIDISKLKKMNINMKTIIICESTQSFIKENLDKILSSMRHKGDEENER